MLGWIIIGAMCLAAYRIADADEELQRPWLWVSITFMVTLGLLIFLPGLSVFNFIIAGVLVFALMIVYKVRASR
jgi:uncharacterized membrane protein